MRLQKTWQNLSGYIAAKKVMEQAYIEDRTFEKIDVAKKAFTKGIYEGCIFLQCDLSNADLSGCKFLDCEFTDCNISMAKLVDTAFNNVTFKGCKMWGLHFNDCNKFGLSLSADNCSLNHSSFYKTIIKKTVLKNCLLKEIDFTDCDASGSTFDNCDFEGSNFNGTNLEKADLRSSYNFQIDPENNRLKKAKFSQQNISGLLQRYGIEIFP